MTFNYPFPIVGGLPGRIALMALLVTVLLYAPALPAQTIPESPVALPKVSDLASSAAHKADSVILVTDTGPALPNGSAPAPTDADRGIPPTDGPIRVSEAAYPSSRSAGLANDSIIYLSEAARALLTQALEPGRTLPPEHSGAPGTVEALPRSASDGTRPGIVVPVPGAPVVPSGVRRPNESVHERGDNENKGTVRAVPRTETTGRDTPPPADLRRQVPVSGPQKPHGGQEGGQPGAKNDPLPNRAPVVVPDVYITPQGEALVVAAPGHLANDTDPDGDALTWLSFVNPDNGTISGASPEGGFTYTPDPGFSGIETIETFIGDGNGNFASGLLVILVEANNGPQIVPDIYITPQGEPLVVAAPGHLANDMDPEGDALMWLSFVNPDNGTVSGASPEGGFTYTPDPGFSGIETIEIFISDGNGNFASGLLVILVEENYAPQVVPDVYVTTQGTPLVVAAPGHLANDIDLEGDALTWLSFVNPDNGTVSGASPEGGFTYTPDPGFSGIETFEIFVGDGNGNFVSGQISIFVEANLAPRVALDLYSTVEGVPLVVAAPGHLANDTDPEGDALTWLSFVGPDNGTISGASPEGGFTYTPDPGFSGIESFEVFIGDGNGNFVNGRITINVLPVGGADLVATPDLYSTPQGTPLVVAAPGHLANDIDPEGDALTWLSFVNPDNGTVSGASPDGGFTYTPDPGFTGIETIEVFITDGNGNFANGLLVIHVEENLAPQAVPDAYRTPQGTPLVVAAPGHLANDIDPEGDELSWLSFVNPDNGTISGASPDGGFTYTPDPGFSGVETVEVSISDGNGNVVSGLIIFYVEENYAPRVVPDAYSTPRGTPLVVAAPGHLANDTDPEGDELSWLSFVNPDNGTVSGASPDGGFTYTPDPGFTGIETIEVFISDGNGNFVNGLIVINVETNYAPRIVPDVYITRESTPLVVPDPGHLANDTDPEGDALTWLSFVNPDNGTVSGASPDGGFTYTPDPGFAGIETVLPFIGDGNGNFVDGLIVILVEANTPPVAVAGADQTVIVGLPVTLDGSGSYDPDGDAITYDWVFATPDASLPLPVGSAAVLEGPNTVSPAFTPDLPGEYTVELTVNDGFDDSAPDYVAVTVLSIAEALDNLQAAVDLLGANGTLNNGQRNALLAKIRQIQRLLDRDQLQQALNVLGALRNQILGWLSAGILSPAQAAVLLAQLDAIETAIVAQQNVAGGAAALSKNQLQDKYRPPTDFSAVDVYPNPFGAYTDLVFDLPEPATVRIEIFDSYGRPVALLGHTDRGAGRHTVRFEAGRLAAGTYTIRLTTSKGDLATQRVVLIR